MIQIEREYSFSEKTDIFSSVGCFTCMIFGMLPMVYNIVNRRLSKPNEWMVEVGLFLDLMFCKYLPV